MAVQFNDQFNTLDTSVWTVNSEKVAPSVSGGQLIMSSNNFDPNYASLVRTSALSMLGRRFSMQFVQVAPNTHWSVESEMGIGDTAGVDMANGADCAYFNVRAGNLSTRVRTDYSNSDVTIGTYDPTSQAYLAISCDATNMYFETSPDGVTWTVVRTAPYGANFDLSQMHQFIRVGYWNTGATSFGNAIIDNAKLQDLAATIGSSGSFLPWFL